MNESFHFFYFFFFFFQYGDKNVGLLKSKVGRVSGHTGILIGLGLKSMQTNLNKQTLNVCVATAADFVNNFQIEQW